MRISPKTFAIAAVPVILMASTSVFLYQTSRPEIVYRNPPRMQSSSRSSVGQEQSSAARGSATGQIPGSVLIDMPFVSQAPLGNWDMPYQEACEESSLILVHHYLTGEQVTPEIMDREIIALTEYEPMELGYHADTTAYETGILAEKFYGHTASVHYDISIEDIKRELAAGNPVILPLAGRDVDNPYYSGEGPWYHMLVVIGYDARNFITHDVGTKRGANYRYPQSVLYDAIHDWTGVKEDIRRGRKAMLVVTQ